MADDSIISVELKDLRRIPRILQHIERHGGRPEKPLKRFLVHMARETGRTFREGGRGPAEWKPLAKVTVAMRKYRKRGAKRTNPKRILQDTGALMRSIRHELFTRRGGKAAVSYAKAPHAKTHQYGGTIDIPRRVIRPKKAKALAFQIGGRTVFAKKVVQPAKTKRVPRRQFLFYLPKDISRAKGLLFDHAREVAVNASKAGR